MTSYLTMVGPPTWNIAGLILVAAGVIVLFTFGMPFRTRRGGQSVIALNKKDDADMRQEAWFDFLGWIGLWLVLLGTAFQIIANLS